MAPLQVKQEKNKLFSRVYIALRWSVTHSRAFSHIYATSHAIQGNPECKSIHISFVRVFIATLTSSRASELSLSHHSGTLDSDYRACFKQELALASKTETNQSDAEPELSRVIAGEWIIFLNN